MNIKKILLFFLFAFLPALFTLAQKDSINTNNYVLCINSYAESSPWSNRIISDVAEYVGKDTQLVLQVEHMNMLMIDNDTLLNEFRNVLFSKYGEYAPRVLVLLGNPSLILRDEYREMWGDIPTVVCGETEYVGAKEDYLKKRPIAERNRIPLSSLTDPYNLVLLHSNLYIRENIDLISHIIPGMDKLIFIGDARQINSENDYSVKEVLNTYYPHINYQFLSAKNLSTNQVLDSLHAMDPATTGVLFSSWLYKETFAGNSFLMTSGYRIITTSNVPIFALNIVDFTNPREGMVGGYAYDHEKYNRELISRISRILAGEQARQLPFYNPSDAAPIINYDILQRKGLSPSLCPPDTHFLNKPLTFWEQNRYIISGSGLFILLLTALFLYRVHNLNMVRNAQRKEIAVMADYKHLVDNMPVLYMRQEVVTDDKGMPADTIFRNVNTYFEKDFFPKGGVINRKSSEIFPGATSEFLKFINIALKENKAIAFPWYFKQSDKFYDAVVTGTRQNNIIDVFCLDSTELHKAQQKLSITNAKLAMALDVANIVPWKWDLSNHTILCDINKPIELSIYGKDVNEEQLAVPDTQYFAKIFKEDRKRVETAFQDLIDGRTDKIKEEYRVVNRQKGMHRIEWVEAQAAVETRDNEGKPLTLVGSSLVITNRKKMELELISAKDRAEESNRLKSAFLANMSHEIRTPLNAIVGFSGILASTDEQKEKQEYVSIIENNNALLLQLISDILDLSKIEAGTLELHYSNVELNQLMKDLENSCRLKLKSATVQLILEGRNEPQMVYTDKNRVSQLMLNLMMNAIKFTDSGSIRFGYEHRNEELYFYVSDTGCGIPKDKQESIFGRFVKLNSFAQGTGLGLSICQTLVRNMGGNIGVESEEGKGSLFWFTLPYKPAITEEPVKKPVYEPIVIEKDKLVILIAEDNESNYKLFESILKYDYRLIHAWDGQEAVNMFREYNPQIILMDINMPGMDGYEATKEIRKYSVKVPIIAITAFAYASDEQRVMESGFDGYMPKPINARTLKAQLADLMQKRVILL